MGFPYIVHLRGRHKILFPCVETHDILMNTLLIVPFSNLLFSSYLLVGVISLSILLPEIC